METKNVTKPVVIKEIDGHSENSLLDESPTFYKEKIKKIIAFGLMIIAFLASMYLLFSPSKEKIQLEQQGFNNTVPQASDATLESDKSKAYEQAAWEQKEETKRNALTTLADYWNHHQNDDQAKNLQASDPLELRTMSSSQASSNHPTSLESYRGAQNTLSSFYRDNTDQTTALQQQVFDLKRQLSEKEQEVPHQSIDNQLVLMEKSYQLASKYFPSNLATSQPVPTSQKESDPSKEPLVQNNNQLSRETTIASRLEQNSESNIKANPLYLSLPDKEARHFSEIKSSLTIKAVVHQDQWVMDQSSVKLRLLTPIHLPNMTIPVGYIVTARASVNNGRMQLKISSIEYRSHIIPVDCMAYDLDGQLGINTPIASEVSAVRDMLANMSQNSATSISMTNSAGQQLAGDLSRGLVQGVSGYFSKKLRTPRIQLKAGYQVFLIQKQKP